MKSLNRRRVFQQLLAVSAMAMAVGAAQAQDNQAAPADAASATAYEPSVGQPGKDVVWVPTAQSLVDQMLRMAEVTPRDYLVDLGSGDGRTVITAAQRGTRAHGVEFNPDLVALSRKAAEDAGVAGKATFIEGDIFETDFSDATVVTMFLLPRLNLRLRPTILEMKPGTRVVSNSFDMDDWEPDDTVEGGPECKAHCRAYKWIVPAKVEGTWKLDDKTSLALDQTFQKLEGHLEINGERHTLGDAVMKGAQILFTANGRQYTGEVDGNQMKGRDDTGNSWAAARQR